MEGKERLAVVIVVVFTIILLGGFWFIPYQTLANISGVLGVALPAFVKVYQEYRRLRPRFEIDVSDSDDIILVLPRNILRLKLSFKNVGKCVIEGAGDKIEVKKDDKK